MEFSTIRMHALMQRGFSLVEVMVAVGVLSVAMLGIGVAMQAALKSGSTANWMTEQAALLKDAQNVVSTPTLCTNALQGMTVPVPAIGAPALEVSLTPATCTYPPAAPAAPTNCAAGGQGIYKKANYDGAADIQHVYFENVQVVNAAMHSYSADVVLQSQLVGTGAGSQNQNVYGNTSLNRTMRVYFTTTGALPSPLLSCLGAWSNDAQTNCTILGGNWTGGYCDMCTAIGCTETGGVCSCGPSSCTVPAGMPWTVGSNTCNADADSIISNGSSATVTDSVDPTIGSGKFSCTAGSLAFVAAGSTCNITQCPNATLSWGAGGACSATAGITDGGMTSSVLTSSSPAGTAAFQCQSNGKWATSPNAGSTCASSSNCSAQSAWTWASNCTGNLAVASSPSGATTPAITNSASGYSGSATFTCSSGSWIVNSGETCAAKSCRASGVFAWCGCSGGPFPIASMCCSDGAHPTTTSSCVKCLPGHGVAYMFVCN